MKKIDKAIREEIIIGNWILIPYWIHLCMCLLARITSSYVPSMVNGTRKAPLTPLPTPFIHSQDAYIGGIKYGIDKKSR